MPSVDTVIIGEIVPGIFEPITFRDGQIAAFLEAGTKGWKAIHLRSRARVGRQAIGAVL